MSCFAEILNIQNFFNSAGNLCTLYMYGKIGFAEKFNILKYINSTGNYVHYTYRMSGFADKLKI